MPSRKILENSARRLNFWGILDHKIAIILNTEQRIAVSVSIVVLLQLLYKAECSIRVSPWLMSLKVGGAITPPAPHAPLLFTKYVILFGPKVLAL